MGFISAKDAAANFNKVDRNKKMAHHPSRGYTGTNKKARHLQALKKQTARDRHWAYLAIGVCAFGVGIWVGIALTNGTW